MNAFKRVILYVSIIRRKALALEQSGASRSMDLLRVYVTVLGPFSKLRKATISFVMSFCPSVRMEQLGSNWTDFHEI